MMDEQLEEIKGEQFADLEQTKIDILKAKLYLGLQEFAENQGQQWTGLRFEKPLLTKLLSLIQQAEKAEELESDIKANKKSVDWLLYQNKRYKEVLEFYANPQIWEKGKLITENRYEMPLAYNDNGEKARQTLRGES